MLSPVFMLYFFIGLAIIIYQAHQNRKARIRARFFRSIEQRNLINKLPYIKNQLAKEYVNQHLEARTTALSILFLSAMFLIGVVCFYYNLESGQEIQPLPSEKQLGNTTVIAKALMMLFVFIILAMLIKFYRQNIKLSRDYLEKLEALFRNGGLAN